MVTFDTASDLFGERFDKAQQFSELLHLHGEERGLIGPRDVAIIWDRHIVNCGLLKRLLPVTGRLVDVGSGAGLPGIVIALSNPNLDITLIEPMERRTTWLLEVVSELGLPNVRVLRGRAEEFHGAEEYDVVTARAVAPMDRLTKWCLPLADTGGRLLALKGQRAGEELLKATKVIRKLGGKSWGVEELPGVDGGESTNVIVVQK